VVTVEVGDGAYAATAQTTLTIENAPPDIDVGEHTVTIFEGSTATSTGSFGDPGVDDVTLTASVGSVVAHSDGTWNWSYDAADGPTDSQIVTIVATDSDDAASTVTFVLTVENLAPVLSVAGDQAVSQGFALQLVDLGLVTDAGYRNLSAGTDETFDYFVDWGDATTASGAVEIDQVGSAGVPTLGSFDAGHTYALPGIYTVTVTVTDDDGDSVTQSLLVAVERSILVLNPTIRGALDIRGNAAIDLPGSLQVNSSHAAALTASGTAQITAGSIRVVGGVDARGGAALDPSPVTGVEPLPDPLAGLTVPADDTRYGGIECQGNQLQVLSPGVYDSIRASGNCQLVLAAGTYVIAGGGFRVTGNASVAGSEVVIYNAGSSFPNPGGTFGNLQLTGNATSTLSSPTSGPYRGVLVFQARDNAQPIALSGNHTGLDGTIYAAAAELKLSGNSVAHVALIVDRLSVTGQASIALFVPQAPSSLSSASAVNGPVGALVDAVFAESDDPAPQGPLPLAEPESSSIRVSEDDGEVTLQSATQLTFELETGDWWMGAGGF
jgi:PKD repeat protein